MISPHTFESLWAYSQNRLRFPGTQQSHRNSQNAGCLPFYPLALRERERQLLPNECVSCGSAARMRDRICEYAYAYVRDP